MNQMHKKYRKSILPWLLHSLPLTLFVFVIFTIIFTFWYYYVIILPLLFTFFVIYRILDDYLDYIELNNDWLTLHLSQWLYHKSTDIFKYNNITITPNRSFWQLIFWLGTLTIQSEGKSYVIKNIAKFRHLTNNMK